MNRMFRKTLIAWALVAALFCGLARPSYAFLDKTRFAAHLGVAYFCFHHWVVKPYKEGKFANGAKGRTWAIAKAGGALLFAVHEVKVANCIAHESNDPTLQKLSGALDGMATSFQSFGSKFKGKQFDNSDMDKLNSSYSDVNSNARSAGISVQDKSVVIPGL